MITITKIDTEWRLQSKGFINLSLWSSKGREDLLSKFEHVLEINGLVMRHHWNSNAAVTLELPPNAEIAMYIGRTPEAAPDEWKEMILLHTGSTVGWLPTEKMPDYTKRGLQFLVGKYGVAYTYNFTDYAIWKNRKCIAGANTLTKAVLQALIALTPA